MNSQMSGNRLRYLITASALLLALGHLVFPSFTIDFITLVLLLVAVLPWTAPLVKSVELPGGFKIQLQDVKEAAQELFRVDTVIQPGTGELRTEGSAPELTLNAIPGIKFEADVISRAETAVASLKSVAGTDSSLALVGFRIEIERRLRELAEIKGLDTSLTLSAILRELRHLDLLPSRIGSALGDLISLGNQAAHGRSVAPEAADWVFEEGPTVLATLDQMLSAK